VCHVPDSVFGNAGALTPIGLLVMQRGGMASAATKRPLGHLVRPLVGLGAMGGFFYFLKALEV